MKTLDNGSVTSPRGFRATGVTAGLKASGKPDMALVVSDQPAVFAAAFTQNLFAAPPVQYCRDLAGRVKRLRALLINSGNANACTGRKGLSDAARMARLTADGLGVAADEVMVFSTGRIGVPLPMPKIEAGIRTATSQLTADGGLAAATAIMTTDTKCKSLAVELDVGGVPVRVGGMAKGAGMIAPNMAVVAPHATLLACVTTDAVLADGLLAECFSEATEQSFNRISVDGDTSTNDSFLALANGAAGNLAIRPGTLEADHFRAALRHVAGELARQLVLDGEGATKFVHVHVTGARTVEQARRAAMAVANSLLCKTAWFGGDPNWGRILDAAGYSGVELTPGAISLDYDAVPVVRAGVDAGTSEDKLAAVLKQREFHLHLNLGAGEAQFTAWTCDLSYEYVKINAEYHT